ncbi:unnamed protein product [Closterium sp. Naga37s-1]|nr:unnamed protein product [Closterium sp. Naga37s-1]
MPHFPRPAPPHLESPPLSSTLSRSPSPHSPIGANSRISLSRPLPICSYWDISRFTPYEWVSPEFYLLAARATLTRPSVGFVWVQSPNMIVKGPFQAGMVMGVGSNVGGSVRGNVAGVGRDRGPRDGDGGGGKRRGRGERSRGGAGQGSDGATAGACTH